MIYFGQIEEEDKNWRYRVPVGGRVILNIDLKNSFMAPMVIQPALKDWINDGVKIAEMKSKFTPVYSYLPPREQQTISLSFQIPLGMKAGGQMETMVRFSSLKNCAVKLVIEVTEPTQDIAFQLFEKNETLELPIKFVEAGSKEQKEEDSTFYTKSIMKLVKGIEGFNKLPSRWVVAEMMLTLCESGYEISQDPEKQHMIRNLQRTIFFKNGVMIISGSQILNWLAVSTSISSSLRSLTGQSNQKSGRILQNWEKWLLTMIQEDIENSENRGIEIEMEEQQSFDVILNKIGNAPDRLFLFFILGVMEVSPRIKSVITQVSNAIPDDDNYEEPDPLRMFADILKEEGSMMK